MPAETTCWTLIEAAANGQAGERNAFAVRYEPLIRAYLGARWKHSSLAQEIADACQDFFVYCFRDGGSLARVERGREGGFRAYLYSTARIIALRWEERASRERVRPAAKDLDFGEIEADETRLSQIFDRAWANVVVQEAASLCKTRAEQSGPEALRRVELLQLRFCEDLPIREIAQRWGLEPAYLHREYAKARDEYSQALFEVVHYYRPDATPGDVHRECLHLVTMVR